jgi:hypothetical protein
MSTLPNMLELPAREALFVRIDSGARLNGLDIPQAATYA